MACQEGFKAERPATVWEEGARMVQCQFRMRQVMTLLVLAIVGALALAPVAHASPTRLLVDDDGRGVPGSHKGGSSRSTTTYLSSAEEDEEE